MKVLNRIFSEALQTEVEIKIVNPDDGNVEKVLILLHGKKEKEEDHSITDKMINALGLEEMCETHHLMVVIPSMKNCYYISTEEYDCVRFVSEELIDYINNMDPYASLAEKILGGVSMGGYGAALIGANTTVFNKIISISGSFIVDDILIGNPEVWGGRKPSKEGTKNTFLSYFLPLHELQDSEKKNAGYAVSLLNGKGNAPFFILSCGTQDWLYPRNIAFIQGLKESGIDHEFISIEDGNHDYKCFREGLWRAFEKK